MEKENIIKLNNRVLEYVLNLNEEEVKGLLDKKYNLKLVKLEEIKPIVKDVKEKGIIEELLEVNNRKSAFQLLNNRKIKKEDLKKIAKENDIYIKSRDTKDMIINKIIESSVGAKLRAEELSK